MTEKAETFVENHDLARYSLIELDSSSQSDRSKVKAAIQLLMLGLEPDALYLTSDRALALAHPLGDGRSATMAELSMRCCCAFMKTGSIAAPCS